MRKALISILIGLSLISLISCKSNNKKNVEKINYWEIAEEYKPGKEYISGDVIYYETDINSKHWYNDSCNSFYINTNTSGMWVNSDGFGINNILSEIPWGGKAKIVGEAYDGNKFYIKDFKIIETKPITQNDYFIERRDLSIGGISEEEAKELYKWCDENEECKKYEENLDNNIYDLYYN